MDMAWLLPIEIKVLSMGSLYSCRAEFQMRGRSGNSSLAFILVSSHLLTQLLALLLEVSESSTIRAAPVRQLSLIPLLATVALSSMAS